MRTKMKMTFGAAACMALLLAAAVPAMADQPIGTVYLSIVSEDGLNDIGPGEVIEEDDPVLLYDGDCWISDSTVSGNSGTPKDSYTYTIELEAADGCYFTDDTVVSVRGAYEVETHLRTTRRMRVRAKAYPYYMLETVGNILIDTTEKKATWDKVSYSDGYSVYVFYVTSNGSERSVRKSVNYPNIDLKSYLDRYDDVEISVLARKGNSVADRYITESYYVYSSGGEMDTEHSSDDLGFNIPEATNTGGLVSGSASSGGSSGAGPGGGSTGPGGGSSTGPGGGRGPGSAGYTGWQGGGDSWCYLQNGTRVTGWLSISAEEWYFLDSAGNMKAGWFNEGGNVYLLNTSHDGTYGKMLTGWQNYNGKWYYFNEVHDGYYGAMNRNVPAGYTVNGDGSINR